MCTASLSLPGRMNSVEQFDYAKDDDSAFEIGTN